MYFKIQKGLPAIYAIEELKNSMPEIKHQIKAIADETKIKITKDIFESSTTPHLDQPPLSQPLIYSILGPP